MMSIPFSPPFIDEDTIGEVTDTLRSGWITTGPKVKELEDLIAKFNQCDSAVAVNSATSALMLALHWYGVGRGDEVIIPAYTYCATALAVKHIGATPIMVDVKSDFTLNPAKIKAAITNKTKAIIPVDIAGWPCDYEQIFEIVSNASSIHFDPTSAPQKKLGRVLILSDSAHSLGAVYKGKPVGALPDISVFSFHAVKNITTAEGGALCLNLPPPFDNGDVYKTLRLWSLNGQTKDAFTKLQAGGWKYDIVYPGFKMNMPDICAAIGVAQLRKYASTLLPRRRSIANMYQENFSKHSWAILPPLRHGDTESSYHLYPIRIEGANEAQRDLIIEEMTQAGIGVNVHFIPLPLLTIFKEQSYDICDFESSYNLYANEISLPIYPQLLDKHIEYVTNCLVAAVSRILHRND
jgi:dTDP-4-amino-4,6-dideoxygalactose transaminase